MAFPTTVDAAVSSAEQPGKYGPFLCLGARFLVTLSVDQMAVTATLTVKKSTDGGVSWITGSTVGAPLASYSGAPQFVPYAVCDYIPGTSLLIAYFDASIGLALVAYDYSSDTWGSPQSIPAPPAGLFSGEGSIPLYQIALAFSASDSSLLLSLAGNTVSLDDVSHAISNFNRFDILGATWSGWIDLGYQDYGDVTTWDLLPCGLVIDSVTGVACAFLQQVSRAGPGDPVTQQFFADDTFVKPGDAPAAGTAEAWGGGGGGNPPGAGPSGVPGSGGGGGAYSSGAVTLTDGAAIVVDPGGLSGAAGAASSFDVVTAGGGDPGVSGTSAPGGAGGAGDEAGGAGGDSGSGGMTGGGGGGSGALGVPGSPGDAGGPVLGGAGGAGAGQGGQGGNDSPFNPPVQGSPGGIPGGGGGGHGVSDLTPPFDANTGGGGQVNISWVPIRNTHDGRMWQQVINPDNSLGALTEITQGSFPSRSKGAQPIPISFDAAILGGKVSIAFTGASSTSGFDNVSVGVGALADPVSFAFSSFSSGNGGNGSDSCPAVAPGAAGLFCCYISTPDSSPVSFLYRLAPSSTFGAAVTIGTLNLADMRGRSRLQANVLAASPEVTFGTPTVATFELTGLN